ncbi:mitochondrial large subunit ribosomal protein-domain-containing protein [Scheffersomyces coipomensis]|uniref:mitochondrial large subunit ribosomal protein-domain-containing protein n=1 Tax=Scheffersomyces coipomensis TaxID=1788519 RepID=UPI00315DD249
MRPSLISLKAVRIPTPKPAVVNYEIPALSSINYTDLPNNGFGIKNYSIEKTKFKHWPVYLKVQNTKLTTEVKRIKGDLAQFKTDLLSINPDLKITVNQTYGYANIKGNVVDEIKQYFDNGIKTDI